AGDAADRVVQVGGGADLGAAGQVAVPRLRVEKTVVLVGQVGAHNGGGDPAELAQGEAVVGVVAGGLDAAKAVLDLRAGARRVVGEGQRLAVRFVGHGDAVQGVVAHRVGAVGVQRGQLVAHGVVAEGVDADDATARVVPGLGRQTVQGVKREVTP